MLSDSDISSKQLQMEHLTEMVEDKVQMIEKIREEISTFENEITELRNELNEHHRRKQHLDFKTKHGITPIEAIKSWFDKLPVEALLYLDDTKKGHQIYFPVPCTFPTADCCEYT